MLPRHAISEAEWVRIVNFLPSRPGELGWLVSENRLFVNTLIWISGNEPPWQDLQERFGNWNSVWRRFERWSVNGTWKRVFEALQDPDLECLILDSTAIPAHQCPAGAIKSGRHRKPGKPAIGTKSWQVWNQDSYSIKWFGIAGESVPSA